MNDHSYLLIFKILIILHNMLTIYVSYACIAYTLLSTWKLTFCPIQALDTPPHRFPGGGGERFQTPQCVSAEPTQNIYPGTAAGLAARCKICYTEFNFLPWNLVKIAFSFTGFRLPIYFFPFNLIQAIKK